MPKIDDHLFFLLKTGAHATSVVWYLLTFLVGEQIVPAEAEWIDGIVGET